MNEYQTDIVWWNAFKDGDKEAFDNLFRRYYPVLVQYGSKICPERDILEDVIHDLFIELWQSKSSNPVKSVRAYFFKALKYKLFRQFRQGQPSVPLDSPLMGGSFVLSHDHKIVEQEEKIESAKRVNEAINQLPARQKEIVYLRIYQGLSYEEISEVMSINYQVARNLFSQSVKSLRNLFFAR